MQHCCYQHQTTTGTEQQDQAVRAAFSARISGQLKRVMTKLVCDQTQGVLHGG